MISGLKAWILSRGLSTILNVTVLFTLDVWLYKTTGSFAAFCFVAAMASLPYIFWAPVAGVLIDKYDRHLVLIVVETIGLVFTSFMLLSVLSFGLTPVSIGLYAMAMGCVGITKLVGVSAFLSTFLNKQAISKVNGIWQVFAGLSALCSPIIGSQIIERQMIEYLLSASLLVYLIVLISLVAFKASPEHKEFRDTSLSVSEVIKSLTSGAQFIFSNKHLFNMVKFFMVTNVSVTVFTVTLTPYLQSMYSTTELGIVTSVLGAGGVVSGIVLARIAVLKDLESKIHWSGVMIGAAILFFGTSSDLRIACAFVFCIGLLKGTMLSLSETFWQTNVPIEIQGKVFAARRLFSYLTIPASIVTLIIIEYYLTHTLETTNLVSNSKDIKPIGYSLMLITAGVALTLYCLRVRRKLTLNALDQEKFYNP